MKIHQLIKRLKKAIDEAGNMKVGVLIEKSGQYSDHQITGYMYGEDWSRDHVFYLVVKESPQEWLDRVGEELLKEHDDAN